MLYYISMAAMEEVSSTFSVLILKNLKSNQSRPAARKKKEKSLQY